MVSTAWSGRHDADLVCVLLDAKAGIDEEADAILTSLRRSASENPGAEQDRPDPAREIAGAGAGRQ
jgi:hypothetical protein